MFTSEAATIARQMMNQHGLYDWTFGWDRAKRRAGACHYHRKQITLSHHHVSMNQENEVRDTILHEIAHALAGPGTGHGWQWRQVCRRIGAKPVRCYDSATVAMPKGKWRAVCGGCNKAFHKHRRPKRQYSCRGCGRERGRLDFQLAA